MFHKKIDISAFHGIHCSDNEQSAIADGLTNRSASVHDFLNRSQHIASCDLVDEEFPVHVVERFQI